MIKLSALIRNVFLLALLGSVPAAIAQQDAGLLQPLARIELYNPTDWEEATVVKVRCGDIASPQAIDWNRIRLQHAGVEVPFALCDGTPHWKAELKAPAGAAHANNVLMFACPVPTEQTAFVDVLLQDSAPSTASAIQDNGTSLVVSYPNLKVVIDRKTGLLLNVEYAGENVLREAMSVKVVSLEEGAVRKSGNLGGWRGPGAVDLLTGVERSQPTAVLQASSSTKAVSEFHFILSGERAPRIGLTYRIHAAGLIEILADGRTWDGLSPWTDTAMQWTLSTLGAKHTLPNLENRWPAYGSKEYSRIVGRPANIYLSDTISTVELGEETLNGRRWHRQLFFSKTSDLQAAQDLAELANEGLLIQVHAHTASLNSESVRVLSDATHSEIQNLLVNKLNERGVTARAASSKEAEAQESISLSLTKDPEALGISGDGFHIAQSPETGALVITAATPFGLMQGSLRTARGLSISEGQLHFPCIASNPTADLRAVGPGGGDHEVDFPYGSDEEWIAVFDEMIASGVNTITCLGMWSNWKMPVSYKYMPELYSDSPDAYDEVTGTHLKDVDEHRERGQKFLAYLQERGVNVWLWIPVGCVPTTFAVEYPEAMCGQSKKTPNFAHPKYQQYLSAFIKELLETYPVDGVVIIRDDNGEICRSADFLELVAKSRSKDPIWEQYLALYDALKKSSFQGDITVYPYHDLYMPAFESFLPDDLVLVGHGSGLGMLSRDYRAFAPMGDTWLDNMYSLFFQLPPSPRMKTLLSDRPSFWLGGAYTGVELPWESIGYFGWNADATPNSMRFEWAQRVLGNDCAKQFLHWSNVNEHLWNMLAHPLLPGNWTQLTSPEKSSVAADIRASLDDFSVRLKKLQNVADERHEVWFQHVQLCQYLVQYRLTLLDKLDQISNIILSHREEGGKNSLSNEERKMLVKSYEEIKAAADHFNQSMAQVPSDMLSKTLQYKLTDTWTGMPEKMHGTGWYASEVFNNAGMSGMFEIELLPLVPGKPCTLRCRVTNTGLFPWTSDSRPHIRHSEEAQLLGLPQEASLPEALIVYGDSHVIDIKGLAPAKLEEKQMTCTLEFPSSPGTNISKTIEFSWTEQE